MSTRSALLHGAQGDCLSVGMSVRVWVVLMAVGHVHLCQSSQLFLSCQISKNEAAFQYVCRFFFSSGRLAHQTNICLWAVCWRRIELVTLAAVAACWPTVQGMRFVDGEHTVCMYRHANPLHATASPSALHHSLAHNQRVSTGGQLHGAKAVLATVSMQLQQGVGPSGDVWVTTANSQQ
jgi:hypothetical protein